MIQSVIKLLTFVFFLGTFAYSQASITWGTYKNKRFGFEMVYPADYIHGKFLSTESGHTFTSTDGKAQIAAYGMLDKKWYGAELYLKNVIQATGRVNKELSPIYPKGVTGDAYKGLIDTQVGKYWITLYGERDDHFFFEYFYFSCADKVVSVLSFSYAKDAEATYEPLTNKLARRFHAGLGSETPRRCM